MSLTQVQSAVAQVPVVGVPGDKYDSSDAADTVTVIAAQDTPFGVVVSFKTAAKGTLPAATGDVTGIAGCGIALRDPTLATTVGYEAGDAMTVMTRGRCFVLAELTVVVTDTPFARFATGTGTQLGAFLKSADTSTAVALPNAHFFQGGGTTAPPVIDLR